MIGVVSAEDGPARQEGGAGRATHVRKTYRHDLDGLRGLAIALVVVYHVWFGRVSGGVDIFLTLSGFFFVGSLVRAAESVAPLAPLAVLRKVGRRLLPPLVVVLAAVAAFTVLYRPSTRWYSVAQETTASMMFWQNWHLAESGSDYLAADPSVSPLQHLWSIALQGQFYIAALALVFTVAWVLRARNLPVRLPVAGLLAVLAVASMAYAIFSPKQQSWVYYDSGARAWELLLGGVLACTAPWLKVPRAWRLFLAVAGLTVVIACGAVLDGRAQFPGPWALVPVGAALALVVAGASGDSAADDNPVSAALGARPLLWLGTIAFSLYLWHWPLLIAYLTVRDRVAVGLFGGAVIITASLLLAQATTKLLETPIRRSTGPLPVRRALVSAVAAVGVAVAVSGTMWVGHVDRNADLQLADIEVDWRNYPGAMALLTDIEPPQAEPTPSYLIAARDVPSASRDGCSAVDGGTEVILCEYGDVAADRTMAVVGGSHAEHWLPAIEVLGIRHGFRVQTMLKVGCAAVLPVGPDDFVGECEEWTERVLDALDEQSPDVVFSTATRPLLDEPGDFTPQNYIAFWQALDERGLPLVGLRDTPWLQENGKPYQPTDCLAASKGDAITCGVNRAEVLSPFNPAEEAAVAFGLVEVVDLSHAFCRLDECRVIEGNVLIYRDADHLTASYVRTLVPALERVLGPATGWW